MYGLCSEAIWNGRTRNRNHELETQKHIKAANSFQKKLQHRCLKSWDHMAIWDHKTWMKKHQKRGLSNQQVSQDALHLKTWPAVSAVR